MKKHMQILISLLVSLFLLQGFLLAQTFPASKIIIDSSFDIQFGLTHQNPLPLAWIDVVRENTAFNKTSLAYKNPSGIGAEVSVWLEYENRPYKEKMEDPNLFFHTNLPIGHEGNPIIFENNFIQKGILFFPFFEGQIILGRQHLSFGPSRLSNLQLTKHIPYYDGFYFELPLGNWKITQLIATLENRKTKEDLPTVNLFGINQEFTDTLILLSMRRFAWSNSFLELAIGGQNLSTRPNNTFQIGDILPIFSIHNGDVGRNNCALFLDAHYTLNEAFQTYAILGFDDINANVIGVNDGGVPTIWASVLGVKGHLPLNTRMSLDYDLEGSYTHYLWGSFDDDAYLSRAIYRQNRDGGAIALPLTSPYGPARLATEWKLKLNLSQNMKAGFNGLLLFGDTSISMYDLDYEGPVKTIHYDFILARLNLNYEIAFMQGLSAYTNIGMDIENYGIKPRANLGLLWQIKNY